MIRPIPLRSMALRGALVAWTLSLVTCAIAPRAYGQIPLEGAAPARWIWAAPDGRFAGELPGPDALLPQDVRDQGERLEAHPRRDGRRRLRPLPRRQGDRPGDRLARRRSTSRRRSPRASTSLAAEATNEASRPGRLPPARRASRRWGRSCPSTPTPPGSRPTAVPAGRRLDAAPDSTIPRWAGPWTSAPWARSPGSAWPSTRATPPAGSRCPRGSRSRRVAPPAVTGSVVAFTFDDEGPPLRLRSSAGRSRG